MDTMTNTTTNITFNFPNFDIDLEIPIEFIPCESALYTWVKSNLATRTKTDAIIVNQHSPQEFALMLNYLLDASLPEEDDEVNTLLSLLEEFVILHFLTCDYSMEFF